MNANSLEPTTRSIYRTAMHILDQQPEWVDPDMGADFPDGTITITQGSNQYTIQLEYAHGLLIAHTSRNRKTLHDKPLATEEDITALFTGIYRKLA